MKSKITLILFLVLSLIFIGCSKKNNDDIKNLQFVWFADGNETEIMASLIKQFELTHPKIKIELVPVSYGQHSVKIKTMIAGGEPPALIRTPDPATFRSFTLDLSKIVKPEEYLDAIQDYYVKDGKTIALPSSITANGMIINTEIFDKAGVKYPTSPDNIWTWDEFIQEMQKLKPYTKYPGVFDASSFRWATMLYEYGGSIWNQTRNKVLINNESGVNALTKFVELQRKGIVDPSVWAGSGDPNSLFRTGKFAFHISGSWMVSNYKNLPFKWSVTYMPIGTRRSSVAGGKYIMPIKSSGVEEEAMEFMKFIAQKKNLDKYCEGIMSLSPRKDSAHLKYEYGSEKFKIFSNELAHTPSIASNDWSNPLMPKIYPKLVDTIGKALSGVPPKQALDDLVSFVNRRMLRTKK